MCARAPTYDVLYCVFQPALPEPTNAQLADLVSDKDPNTVFNRMVKIGQGTAGEVFYSTYVDGGERVAVKKMPITEETTRLLITEIGMMTSSLSPSLSSFL